MLMLAIYLLGLYIILFSECIDKSEYCCGFASLSDAAIEPLGQWASAVVPHANQIRCQPITVFTGSLIVGYLARRAEDERNLSCDRIVYNLHYDMCSSGNCNMPL